ncbi:hypothetical protein [Sigmofec virus UA08Rod_6997]|uniref:Uncharacterized protein n=1 Tax=Sigmofec virus UA08Rod_6997 TaxID=2929243 RepID=A0A976N0Q9_9VIRU|nr:hypothetical protein [Sigmofec virus UA08Rod_6997]
MSKFRSFFDESENPIGEFNDGDYIVDNTGYISLEEQLKRCLRERSFAVEDDSGIDPDVDLSELELEEKEAETQLFISKQISVEPEQAAESQADGSIDKQEN